MSIHRAWAVIIEDYCQARLCRSAAGALRSFLAQHPDEYEGWYRLGICCAGACGLKETADQPAAVDSFTTALRLAQAAPDLTRGRILEALGNALSEPGSQREVDGAIVCLQRAAQIYLDERRLADWARVENNLGLAYCELPEPSLDKWARAVEEFEKALLIRSAGGAPRACAATLQNLGAAYRMLPGAQNVRKAIGCYRRALRIYASLACARNIAAVHNNLGNAFLSLPEPDATKRSRRLEAAVRHFDRALRVRTRESGPYDYAVTQMNRGQALAELAGARAASNNQAAVCFREAQACFESCGCREAAGAAHGLLERVNTKGADHLGSYL